MKIRLFGLNSSTRRTGRANETKAPRSRRLRLENLESRELLAVSALECAALLDAPADAFSDDRAELVPDASAPDALDVAIPTDGATSTAKSLVVTTTSDAVDEHDAVLSLREAISLAGTPGYSSTITFGSSLKGETISLTGVELTIKRSMTIDASGLGWTTDGKPSLTINAQGLSRIFNVSNSKITVSVKGMTLTGGSPKETKPTGKVEPSNGGAIYSLGVLTLDSCVLKGNTGGLGGALSLSGSSSSATIKNSLICENTATSNGAGIYCKSGVLTLDSCVLKGNKGRLGGALFLSGRSSTTTIKNSLICENTATSQGAGIYCQSVGNLEIVNTTIARNSCPESEDTHGGGIMISFSTVNLTNTIVAGNTSGNDYEICYNQKSDVTTTIKGSNVLTNFANWTEVENVVPFYSLTETFVDAENGDYRLTSYSPALDAGNTSFATSAGLTKDVAGRARVDGTSVDIGAYERVDSDPTSARSTSDCHNDFYIDVIYDADKEMNTDKDSGDSKLCWAAAASNALWFTQWGQIANLKDEEAVFHDVFAASFPNEEGRAFEAYLWFLDGSGYKNVEGGRYYSVALTANGESAYSYVDGYDLRSVSSVVEMTEKLRSGVGVAISIAWFKNYNYTKENRVDGHALSVYGYSYNPQLQSTDPGYITKLYVADSNDYGILSGRRDRKLQTLNLVWNKNLNYYVVDNYQVKSGVLPVLEEAFVIAPRPVKYDPNAANDNNLYFFEKIAEAPTSQASESLFSIKCDGSTSLANNKEATLSFSFLSNAAIPSGVKYEVFIDDASYGVFSTDAIAPGRNTLSRPLGYLASGSHVVRVALDSAGAIAESNEQDNFYATTIDVDKVESRPLETASTVVTTLADVVDAFDGAISLREALAYATAGDVVSFDPFLAGKTIVLSNGQLEISKSLTIDASALWDARNDKPGITIDANCKSRVFYVDEDLTVSFNGLAITGGYILDRVDDGYDGEGGGVYAASGVVATFTDCEISRNDAYLGGGVFVEWSAVATFDDCEISYNGACFNEDEPDYSGCGGGVYAVGVAKFRNCEIAGNRTVNAAGGNFNGCGGGVYVDGAATFDYCSIASNSADSYGGGVCIDGEATFGNCAITGNKADYYSEWYECLGGCGGGVYVRYGAATFVNSAITGNSAGFDENFDEYELYWAGCGGGVYVEDGEATFVNSTIAGNAARQGGGVCVLGDCSVVARNTIIALNAASTDADVYAFDGAEITGFNTLSTFADWTSGSKNNVYDASLPLFLDADAGNYLLAPDSQAIDKGANAYAVDATGAALQYDLSGRARVNNGIVDLGAYENRPPEAASTVVTTLADVVDAYDEQISLREALAYATDGDVVSFAPSLAGGTIALSLGQLEIAKSVTIDASAFWNSEKDQPGITIDANNRSRVFYVGSNLTVSFNGLAITGGWVKGYGGGVYVLQDSDATFTDCAISSCNSLDDLNRFFSSGGYGGGVFLWGGSSTFAKFINCAIADNNANFWGGGVYVHDGGATFDNCAISGNLAYWGGGVYVGGDATFDNCAIANNVASQSVSDYNGGFGGGGGVCVREGGATFDNCAITGNLADYGGGVYVRIGEATFANCAITDNWAGYISGWNKCDCGGGVYVEDGAATFLDCEISTNNAENGGGIYASSDSVTTFTKCAISDNLGGGVCAYGVATFENCAITDNSAVRLGGGVCVYGAATFANCSIAGNTAHRSDGDGGGVFVAGGGAATFANCTIARNTAFYGGGIYVFSGGSVAAYNTIVALNATEIGNADIYLDSSASQIEARNTLSSFSGWTSGSNNFVYQSSQPLFTNAAEGDYSLAPDSQAIDNGNNAYAVDATGAALESDLSGRARINNRIVDLGAYEYFSSASSSGETPEAPSTVVTTLEDVVDKYDDLISLREALEYASDGDVIYFAPYLAGQTIVFSLGQLEFTKSATIDASSLWNDDANKPGMTIDGNRQSRVFYVDDNVIVSFNGLAITGGCASDEDGGGVFVDGDAIFSNCVISGNEAVCGGGVCVDGDATFANCTISGNSAREVGGGICARYGAVLAENTIVALNVATTGAADVCLNGDSTIAARNTLSTFTDWTSGSNNYVYDARQPLFANAAAGDYSLAAGSQAIDKGNNEYAVDETGAALEYDVSGRARVYNDLVDLGAYEYQTPVRPLSTPSLEFASSTSTSIGVKWKAISGAKSYTLQYKLSDAATWTSQGVKSTATSFTIAGLTPDATYEVRIRANGDGGVTWYSSNFSAVLTAKAIAKLATPSLSTSGTSDSITAHWDPVEGAKSYTIQYKLSTDDAWSNKGAKRTDSSCTISGLTPGATYDLRIRANGDGGATWYSSEFSATVSVKAAPKLVRPELQLADSTNSSITLEWSAISGVKSYTLQYKLSTEDESSWTNQGVRATETSFTVSGLTKNASYDFRLRANGDGGATQYSSDFSKVLTASAIQTVRALAAPVLTVGATTTDSIALSWSAVEGAASYRLQYKLASASAWRDAVAGTSETSFVVSGLSLGASYDFRVKSLGDGVATSDSDYGAVVSGSTLSAPKLATPSLSTSATSDSITAHWDAISGAKSYTVQYKLSTDDAWTNVGAQGTQTSKTISGLTPGATYQLRIRANGDGGATYLSSDFSATVSAKAAPKYARPELAFVGATNSSITLEWGAISEVKSYTLQYKLSSESSWTNQGVRATETSFTVAGLTKNASYDFRLRANGDGGATWYSSDFSGVLTASAVLTARPLAAPALAVVGATSGTISLSWNAVENASSYSIEYKLATANEWTTTSAAWTSTSATLTGLTPGGKYNVRMAAVGDGVEFTTSDYSATATQIAAPKLATPVLLNGGSMSESLAVAWQSVEGAKSYTLQYKLSTETTWTNVGVRATETTYTLSGLTQGGVYQIQLRANGDGGATYLSSEFSAKLTATAEPKLAPPTLVATPTADAVALSWNSISGAKSYTLQYKLADATSWTNVGIRATETSYTVFGLTSGTYEFRLRANGDGGATWKSSEFSDVCATTLGESSELVEPFDALLDEFDDELLTALAENWN